MLKEKLSILMPISALDAAETAQVMYQIEHALYHNDAYDPETLHSAMFGRLIDLDIIMASITIDGVVYDLTTYPS